MDLRTILSDHGIEDATQASLDGEFINLRNSVTNLSQYVDGAFHDGVITEMEARKIQTYINIVNDDYKRIEARHEEVYNNADLDDTDAKDELLAAKTDFDIRYSNLIADIQYAIADGRTTPEDAEQVDRSYLRFMEAASRLERALEVAVNVIIGARSNKAEQNARQYADTLRGTIGEDTDALMKRLLATEGYIDGAFRDGVITEAEAQNIRSYLNSLPSDKVAVDERFQQIYNNYFLQGVAKTNLGNAKANYDQRYTDLVNTIESVLQDGKATPEEADEVRQAFVELNTALSTLTRNFEQAIDSLSQRRADEAEKLAKEAAAEYTDREVGVVDKILSDIAADSKLTVSERIKIKDDLTRITGVVLNDNDPLPTIEEIDDDVKEGEVYSIRRQALQVGLSSNHQDFIALENAYTALKGYLEEFSPYPWSTASSDVIEDIDKYQWRRKWLNYYTGIGVLAQRIQAEFKEEQDRQAQVLVEHDSDIRMTQEEISFKLSRREYEATPVQGNHIHNSDFRTASFENWTAGSNWSVDTTFRHYNGNTARVTAQNDSSLSRNQLKTEDFQCAAGEVISTSLYVYIDNLATFDGNFLTEVVWLDIDENIIESSIDSILPSANPDDESGQLETEGDGSREWIRFLHYNKAPEGTVRGYVLIYPENNGIAWISRVMIQKGELASSWVPHADEQATFLQQRVANAESEISQTAEEIQNRVTRTEFNAGIDGANSAAEAAQESANEARQSAQDANSMLSDLSNDNRLTPGEKKTVRREWDVIRDERSSILSQADTYSITEERDAYTTAYNQLNAYITPLLNNMDETSAINGSDFRHFFRQYYEKRQDLLRRVADVAKNLSDYAQETADNLKDVVIPGLDNRLTETESTVTQTAESIQSMVTKEVYEGAISDLDNRISSNASTIEQTATEIASRVTKDELQDIEGRVVDTQNHVAAVEGIANSAVSDADNARQLANAAQKASDAAADLADQAQTSARKANDMLDAIASDDRLTPDQKKQVRKEMNQIRSEVPKYVSQAGVFEVETTDFQASFDTLDAYVTPLLSNMEWTTTIDGDEFRDVFADYYDQRTILLGDINYRAKQLADDAQSSADDAKQIAETLRDKDIPTLITRVSEAESEITQTAEAINQRVTRTEYESYQADVSAQIEAANQFAETKASEAQSAAETFAAAQAEYERIKAETHAESKISEEAQTRISEAEANLNAARQHAEDKAEAARLAAEAYAGTRASEAETNAKTHTNNRLSNYVEASLYNLDLEEIRNQIDGNITTWFYDHEPTMESEPAVNWTDDETRNKHLGDIFYEGETGYAYRFAIKNGEYLWKRLKDSDIQKAIADAAEAQATADVKRRVFVVEPQPPYDVGDLWVQGENGDIYKCVNSKSSGSYNSGDWEKASKYTDDTRAIEAEVSAKAHAESKAAAAQSAAEAHAEAQAELERIKAEAYADGKISEEEAARIAEAKANLAEAKQHADDAAATAQSAAKSYAETKANEAQSAAEAHAEAQAELERIKAEAYADGKISEEEAARIAEAKANLAEAKQHAETKASEAEVAAKSHAETKANAAQAAAEAYAAAQAELERVKAEAYADGIVSEEEQARIDQAKANLEEAKQHAEERSQAALESSKQYVQSRGENLVTNGTGMLGDNTNFSSFDFNSTQLYSGRGSFTYTTTGNGTAFIDELIPVDPERTYLFAYAIKQLPPLNENGTPRAYSCINCYDVDGNRIGPQHYRTVDGSAKTHLTQDLRPGDTYIHVGDTTGWHDGNTSHQRGIVAYGYTNDQGYTYPDYTYSRYSYGDIWDEGAIDRANNRIQLRNPWSGPTFEAGRAVANRESGNTYIYPGPSNFDTPTEWEIYGGKVGPDGDAFRPGTAFVDVGWLLNRSIEGSVTTAVSAVTFGLDFETPEGAQRRADEALSEAKSHAESKADAAREAAETYAKAQAEYERIKAESYADGKVSDEEEARINEARDNLAEAKAHAEAKAQAAEEAASAFAELKAQQAKEEAFGGGGGSLVEGLPEPGSNWGTVSGQNYGNDMEVREPIKIISAVVYSDDATSIRVRFLDLDDGQNTIFDENYDLTPGESTQIKINKFLPPGSYRMIGTPNGRAYRTSRSGVLPVNAGGFTITGSNASRPEDFYYYFYELVAAQESNVQETKQSAEAKIAAAQAAAEAHAEARAEAERIIAEAYADGIVSDEEQARIAEALANLKEAKEHADSKAAAAESAARAHAESKAAAAQSAAEAYALAKAEAERIKAEEYADGELSKEQEARIAEAKANLEEAKKHAEDAAKAAEEASKGYTDDQMAPIAERLDVAESEIEQTAESIANRVTRVEYEQGMDNVMSHADLAALNASRALIIDSNETKVFHFDNHLRSTDGTVEPIGDPVVTLRPSEGKFGGGLAVEPATTNLIDDKFFEDGWSEYRDATVTRTQNVSVPEWRTNKATHIKTSGGTSSIKTHSTPITNANIEEGQDYVLSVYLKNNSEHPIRISTNRGEARNYPAGFMGRVVLKVEWSDSQNSHLQFRFEVTEDVDRELDFIVYQPQLEHGLVATSFTSDTRDEDGILELPTSLLNHKEGTLSMWMKHPLEFPYSHSDYDQWTFFRTGDDYGASHSLNFQKNHNEKRFLGVHWGGVNGSTHHSSFNYDEIYDFQNGGYNLVTITWKDDEGWNGYLNGRLVRSVSVSSGDTLKPFDNDVMRFTGMMIDELRIDNVARTEEEIKQWYDLSKPFIDTSNNEFTLEDERGKIALAEARLSNAEQLITADAIVNTVTSSTSFGSALGSKVDPEDLEGLATRTELEEAANDLLESMNNKIEDIDFSPYVTNSQLEQESTSITSKFVMGGGVNLLRNSVGLSALDFWSAAGEATSGKIQTVQSNEINSMGFPSGLQFLESETTWKAISQVIPTRRGRQYTFSNYLNKQQNSSTNDTLFVLIYEINEDGSRGAEITRARYQDRDYAFEFVEHTFTAGTNRTEIRIYGDQHVTAVMTGIMLNVGDAAFQWTMHPEELYNSNIRMDINGIRVSHFEEGEEVSYTTITPDEFAGYFDRTGNGNFERVFYLREDETVSKKFNAEEEFTMGTIKILRIESDLNKGWAFVPTVDMTIYEDEDEGEVEDRDDDQAGEGGGSDTGGGDEGGED